MRAASDGGQPRSTSREEGVQITPAVLGECLCELRAEPGIEQPAPAPGHHLQFLLVRPGAGSVRTHAR